MFRKRLRVISLVMIGLAIAAGGYLIFSSSWERSTPVQIPVSPVDVTLQIPSSASSSADADVLMDSLVSDDANSDLAAIPFDRFEIDQPLTVTIAVDDSYIARLSTREQNEQFLDWLLFALAADSGLTVAELNQSLFDLFPVREVYTRPVSSFEYGVTRSFYAGDGQIVALIPEMGSQEQMDLLAEIADQHYKNTGEKPIELFPFSYNLNLPVRKATITRLAAISGDVLFSAAYGYYEQPVQSEAELSTFLEAVDDLSFVRLTDDGLLLGGRQLLSRTYSGIQPEDVAALWHAYETNPVSGIGFSLDPAYDYEGLSQQFILWRPQLEVIASRANAPISLLDIEYAETQLKNGLSFQLRSGLGGTPRFEVVPREAGLIKLINLLVESTDSNARATGQQMANTMQADFQYQAARYDGPLRGTAVGMTLFYTDLLAKLWALDYLGGAPTNIDGFTTFTQIRLPSIYYQEALELPNTRLWFGPKSGGFQSLSSGTQPTLLFSRTATSVYAASYDALQPKEGEVTATTNSTFFLDWMNDHYEEIAIYEPQYQRLNQIMKWSLLMSWLGHQQKLSQLAFVHNIKFQRDYWFPQWLQTQQNLSYKHWNEIAFYPPDYLGAETEALPRLTSQQFTIFPEDAQSGQVWRLSGGVSLPDPEIFRTRDPLDMAVDPRLRRAFIHYDGTGQSNLIQTLTNIDYRLATLPDNIARVTVQERQVQGSEAVRPRTLYGELATRQLFARNMWRNGESWNVETYIGDALFNTLLLAPTQEGIQVTVSSGDVDIGIQLALDYGHGDTLAQIMANNPQVQTVIPLPSDQGFLFQFEGSPNWLHVVAAERGSIGVPEPWQMVVADRLGSQRNVLVGWQGGTAILNEIGGYLVQDAGDQRLVRYLTDIPAGLTAITVVVGDSSHATVHLDRQTGILYYQLDELSNDFLEHLEKLLHLLQPYDLARIESQLADGAASLIYDIPAYPYQGLTEEEVTRLIVADPEAAKMAEQAFLDYQSEVISYLLAQGQYEEALKRAEQLWHEPYVRNYLWTDLAVQDGKTVEVTTFINDNKEFVLVAAESEVSTIAEVEVVAYSPEGILQLVTGDIAVDWSSRGQVKVDSNADVTFVYLFEEDGAAYAQAGPEKLALPQADSLVALDEVLPTGETAVSEVMLAPLYNLETPQIVLFSGQGFADTDEGEVHRMVNLRRVRAVTQNLIASGLDNVNADDDTYMALNNLAAQMPLVNGEGQWNLTLLIDGPSFAGEEAGQELARIEEAAARVGVSTSRNVLTPTLTANIFIITARDDAVLLETMGWAGALSGKHVTNFVVEQAQTDRTYTRVAITEFDATGIMVNEGPHALSLPDTRVFLESMFSQPQSIQGKLPATALIHATNTEIEQESIDLERKELFTRFRDSFIPSVSQRSGWGSYI